MPVYEYECGHCHCCFEKRQRFDEEPATVCPECQGSVRRVFHSTPIIFKGSGFYVTDSRKNGEKSLEKVPEKSKDILPAKKPNTTKAITTTKGEKSK